MKINGRKEISIHVPHAGHDRTGDAGIRKPGFQSTCPMRGTTSPTWRTFGSLLFQSTCPMRGTTPTSEPVETTETISIHVPHAGHDPISYGGRLVHYYFNPRAPCGARRPGRIAVGNFRNFNPRAPCGARLKIGQADCIVQYFNPRAPCGARRGPYPVPQWVYIFQSTCPMRGTTGPYPVPPWVYIFQSTCPMRGTTAQIQSQKPFYAPIL